MIKLLPQNFKKIGLVVMIIALLPAVYFIVTKLNLTTTQKDGLKIYSYDVFILGLAFIAFSKDKIEDEITLMLRYRAMAFAFLLTIISVMLTPLINLFFKDQTNDSAREIVFTMLITYLFVYYVQKSRR